MRPTRDEMFMRLACIVATRSTCLRGNVGALIVVDRHVVSMGYNGAPPGMPHCDEVGCDEDPRTLQGCQRATHAELNAVAFAARQGIPCIDGTMYCTHACCVNCARAVVAAGISKVMYQTPYRLAEGLVLLDKCNVVVEQYYG